MTKIHATKAAIDARATELAGAGGRFLAIDPGTSYFAWARMEDGKLVSCGRWDEGDIFPEKEAVVVMEVPDRLWKGTIQDLLLLTFRAGVWARSMSTGTIIEVRPAQWKKQLDKKIHHPRIAAELSEEERTLLPTTKSESVHVLDAIGLAQWWDRDQKARAEMTRRFEAGQDALAETLERQGDHEGAAAHREVVRRMRGRP